MGVSGTSARQATASDPVRIAFARSSLGGAVDVIPLAPPCVWTSTDRVPQNSERSGDSFGDLLGGGRTARFHTATHHRSDRGESAPMCGRIVERKCAI